jgi:hypothetical protein
MKDTKRPRRLYGRELSFFDLDRLPIFRQMLQEMGVKPRPPLTEEEAPAVVIELSPFAIKKVASLVEDSPKPGKRLKAAARRLKKS